jgi:hypothetical protein
VGSRRRWRAERLFRAPVGGIERRVEEEAEDRVDISIEVARKLSDAPQATGAAREDPRQARETLAAGGGEPVMRQRPSVVPIARGERRCKIAFTAGAKACCG